MRKPILLLSVIFVVGIFACQRNDSQSFVKKGITKAERSNYDGALEAFNQAIELDPENKEAYFARAFYAKEHLEDYEGAIEDYTKVIDLENNDNDAKAYSQRGHAKTKLKNYKEAVTDFEKAISLDPSDPYTYRNRALLFIEVNNPPMVCFDLKKALEHGFTEKHGNEVQELYDEHCDLTEK
jgi:tetratricopeptide (TPR) repeat protein